VKNKALIILPPPKKGASYNGAPAPLIGRCAFFPANGPFFELIFFLAVNRLFTDQWPFYQTMVILEMDFFFATQCTFCQLMEFLPTNGIFASQWTFCQPIDLLPVNGNFASQWTFCQLMDLLAANVNPFLQALNIDAPLSEATVQIVVHPSLYGK
jgi:hypothetical protein